MFRIDLYQSNRKIIIISIAFILLLSFINFLSNHTASNHDDIFLSSLGEHITKAQKLVISELMSSNKGALVDEEGNLCDWIEIYNGYNHSVNLKNYALSDSESGLVKWVFPNIEIESKEYLIVYLSKEISGELHASFSLKQAGGEFISLKKPNGKIIDSVKTVRLPNNASMTRDENGKWIVTDEITPGYENTKAGREKFLSSFQKSGEYPLVLSEFLPSNEGNILFDNNRLYGYVEVVNTSDKIVHLKDYYLSNNEKSIYKWRFPDVHLGKNEVYVVYTNSLDYENNASFDLKHKIGNVILSTYEGIIENVSYHDLTNGAAYVKEDGKWTQGINISPGYLNTPEGKVKFQEQKDQAKKNLIISELMSSNNQYLAQNGNQFYDWIELYNNTDQIINLKEYSLTTDSDDKNMYQLPEKVLMPGAYYVVMASGDTKLSNTSYDHANFKLSSGTGLFLYNGMDLVDGTYIYSIPKGYSYGRGLVCGHFYYATPTPGRANSEAGLRRLLYEPIFSKAGGVYNGISSLDIELQHPSYTDIYYTLDGSLPTIYSMKYTHPISLTSTTVVRAAAYLKEQQMGNVVTNSYIINENHTLPVMSVSMPKDSFQYIQNHIDSNSLTAAHAELYEKNSSFSIDCSFKLYGGQGKEWSKKSFSLNFDDTHLHYKVFDTKDLFEFNALVLRSGSQDQSRAMMRDEFATSIALKYGTLDAQANKPIVLYINGSYWGIYYIREKINASFISNNYNVKGSTNITNYYYLAEEGANTAVVDLKNYIAWHDMTNASYYNYVTTLLDIDNYIDFWVFEYIVNNQDFHNYRYYNNPLIAGGKVRMILFDLDYSMLSNYGANYLNHIQYPTEFQTFVDTTILAGLMKNSAFRKRFVQRVSYYLGSVWTVENIEKEFSLLYNSLNPEMPRNCARWGFSYESWNAGTSFLKNYALNRIWQIKNEVKNYFYLSQEEMNEYFS